MPLQASESFFASDDLGGKNLFCEEHNLFVTYNFLDNKRYKTTNYFLVYFDIGIREGTYGYLNNPRYLFLKADKKLEIYNKLNKTDNEKNWQKKVAEVPKLDYYLDTQDLNINQDNDINNEVTGDGNYIKFTSANSLATDQWTDLPVTSRTRSRRSA